MIVDGCTAANIDPRRVSVYTVPDYNAATNQVSFPATAGQGFRLNTFMRCNCDSGGAGEVARITFVPSP